MLATGFYGDDASDANLNGYLAMRGVSLAHATAANAAAWLHANGRLFPLYVAEKFVVFHVFAAVDAYKAFLLLLSLATLGTFVLFVRALAGTPFAVGAALVAAASLQMRGYHDALYSYNGMVQIMAIVLFVSLLCWRAYLRGGPFYWAAAAVALYAANGLTYEFSYLFFPLYAAVSVRTRPADLARAAAPFAVVSAALGGVAAWLRGGATIAATSPYAVGHAPGAYVSALGRQLTAALPLSYFWWNPSRIFPSPPHVFDRSGGYELSVLTAAFFAVAGYIAARDLARALPRGPSLARVAWVGAGLWILPALLVAASVKYQRELVWGIGYLPVLIEVFGVALIATAGFAALVARLRSSRTRAAVVVCAALLVGVAGAVTLADNRRLARELVPWRLSRAVVGRALAAGVARDVPQGADLAVADPPAWMCFAAAGCPDDLDARYFVYAASGQRVELRAGAGGRDVLRYGASPAVAWVVVTSPAGALVYLEALPGAPCARLGGGLVAARPGVATVERGSGWALVRLAGAGEPLATACGPVRLAAGAAGA